MFDSAFLIDRRLKEGELKGQSNFSLENDHLPEKRELNYSRKERETFMKMKTYPIRKSKAQDDERVRKQNMIKNGVL